jgi:Lipopolysaccharide kinase (Kdo/WaaP) family
MIRLYLNPAFKDLLEHSQLSEYAQFMATTAGDLIDKDSRRDVRKIQLGENTCFLKRTWVEKAGSALENYLTGSLAHSKPYKEMLQIQQLQYCGFAVAQVIAAGERLRFGIPVEGFILTAQAPGQSLPECYDESTPMQKMQILKQLGTLVGQLHRRGFFLSVRLKDVFSKENTRGGKPTLTLIDREARNPMPKKFSPGRAKEGLYVSWRRQVRAGDAIPPAGLRAFLQAYCKELRDVWPITARALMGELKKMAEK